MNRKRAITLIATTLFCFVLILVAAFPSLKFKIYNWLPASLRFQISSAMSDHFLVGMIFFIEKDGCLMLVKHTYQNTWGLPGGWLEHGETIEEGARREIREEFGVDSDSPQILRTNAVKSKPVIDVALSLHLLGVPRPDQLEVKTAKFFPLDSLPDNIIRTHKPYINEYLKGSLSSHSGIAPTNAKHL